MGLRYNADGNDCLYFITTSVVKHLPVLTSKGGPKILIENIKFYREKYSFELNGYVIMPTHIHLILFVPENKSISDIMRDFKKYTSVQFKEKLINEHSKYLPIMKKEGRRHKGQEFKLWNNRSDKVAIVSKKVLKTKLNYIHDNPVRKGLVDKPEHYKYSSAKDYLTNEESEIVIDEINLF